jgi:hypothetical protein
MVQTFQTTIPTFLGRERTTCILITIEFPFMTDLINNLSRVFFYTPIQSNSFKLNQNQTYIT